MSNNYKIRPFRFLKSINKLLLISGCLSLIAVGLMILVFALRGRFDNQETVLQSVLIIIGYALMIFPLGLVILSIVATILTSSRLSKKSFYINNFSAIESLANTNLLCVDKVCAITDGKLTIKKVIPLKANATEEYLSQWISNVLKANDENNLICQALLERYDLELSAGIVNELPYNNTNKYFGASFKGGKTIIIGEPEYLPIKNQVGIIKRCEEEVKNGYTVLVIGEGKEPIQGDAYTNELEPIALIVLKEHVREKVSNVFNLFKKNDVRIVVMSSENDLKTSVIAAEAGVDNADNYCSLYTKTAERINEVANQHTVFAEANAGQKRVLISSFKYYKYTVMAIGDGINDSSVLRNADCSLTITDEDKVTAMESDFVLTNSSFGDLPSFVNEGKIVVNKLTKIASLFTIKTMFAFVMSIVFVLISLFNKDSDIGFPIIFNHLLPWDLASSGVAALFLLLEKNKEKTNGLFLVNVIKKALLGALMFVLTALSIILLYVLQKNGLTNLGIYSIDAVSTMIAVAINILGIACFYQICNPLNKYRTTVLVLDALGTLLLLGISLLIALLSKRTDPIFVIPFLEANGPSLITMFVIAAIFAAIYIFVNSIVAIKKGDSLEDEN